MSSKPDAVDYMAYQEQRDILPSPSCAHGSSQRWYHMGMVNRLQICHGGQNLQYGKGVIWMLDTGHMLGKSGFQNWLTHILNGSANVRSAKKWGSSLVLSRKQGKLATKNTKLVERSLLSISVTLIHCAYMKYKSGPQGLDSNGQAECVQWLANGLALICRWAGNEWVGNEWAMGGKLV
ncbi:hypothetical protein BU17DRAFT_64242 [Hysterangium stoloniferum]|nr:hypothetical protein BU17DRAFT_64242 [Hysterangium stoloniferum]